MADHLDYLALQAGFWGFRLAPRKSRARSVLFGRELLADPTIYLPYLGCALLSLALTAVIWAEHYYFADLFYAPLLALFAVHLVVLAAQDPLPLDGIGALSAWLFWVGYTVVAMQSTEMTLAMNEVGTAHIPSPLAYSPPHPLAYSPAPFARLFARPV